MQLTSITESITNHLRNEIIVGSLRSGERLNEAELASGLKISRAPLREALRILQTEGLVTHIPRKGTYVTELSIDHLEKLFQAREMVECYAIELLKLQNKRELPDVLESLKLAAKEKNPGAEDREGTLEYFTIFAGYHRKLVESAGNEIITNYYASLSHHLFKYQIIYLYLPWSEKRSIGFHREILTSIGKGAFDDAKEKLRDHIRHTCEVLKKKIAHFESA